MDKKFYLITVVGAKRADQPDKVKYMRDANVPAGFNFGGPAGQKRSFFHLELTEAAENTVIINGRTVKVPNPQMKPFTFNCFERTHREMFKAVLTEIKTHKEDSPAYTKDAGDKEGLRIILDNLVIPGRIIDFELPYEVYRVNRDPKTHKMVKFKAKRYAKDGSIEEVPVTTKTGQTFLYGNQTDAPDVFTNNAILAVLKVSEKVELNTQLAETHSAPENSVQEESEPETETAETAKDDQDV